MMPGDAKKKQKTDGTDGDGICNISAAQEAIAVSVGQSAVDTEV